MAHDVHKADEKGTSPAAGGPPVSDPNSESQPRGSFASGLGRLAVLLLLAAVGAAICWEAVNYACYALTVRGIEAALKQEPVDSPTRLRLHNIIETQKGGVPSLTYGAPTIVYEPLGGNKQVVTYAWQGLFLTYGPMYLVYDQEDQFFRIEEVHGGVRPQAPEAPPAN
jgi:hypothetical protein